MAIPKGKGIDKEREEIQKKREERSQRTAEGNRKKGQYKPEYCQLLVDYFRDTKCFEEETERKFSNTGEVISEKPVIMAKDFPTFVKFAQQIGISNKTLNYWEKTYPDFKEAMDEARIIQQDKFHTAAIIGVFNPNYSKFFAMNKYNMSEKNDSDSTVKVVFGDDVKEKLNKYSV